jgi:CxxC motif-containing protein (DUF1111 family)
MLLAALALPAGAAGDAARADLSPDDLARVRGITTPTRDFSVPERFELMQGGAGTIDKLVNADIFSQPAANLTAQARQDFIVGNGLFRKDWVAAPASTHASDGLGPLYNARSCQGCHVKDGRGTIPTFDGPDRSENMALLMRLSIPRPDPVKGGPQVEVPELFTFAEPTYGFQLQPFAATGLPGEGRIDITYEEVPVALNGGETATLLKPAYRVRDPGYGPMHPKVMMSPRLAPPVIGLGLLEAIHEADILANARRDAGDGVSGRPNRARDLATDQIVLGRFGWKAGQPSVGQQNAVAFFEDMGLSTPLLPTHHGDCTVAQPNCLAMPHGAQPRLGKEEVPGKLAELVAVYAQNLGVPQRRDVDNPRILAGKQLFYASNCVACHVPKYVTRRDAPRAEHRFQLIWPYTDLLLHDMGDGLADGRPEGDATGNEWRTPPLWGIGLTKTVNPQATWLHDGRARNLLEAVLWHGGEATRARDRVVAMTPEERADLIRFLESL